MILFINSHSSSKEIFSACGEDFLVIMSRAKIFFPIILYYFIFNII